MLKWNECMVRYKAEQKSKLKTVFCVALIAGAFLCPFRVKNMVVESVNDDYVCLVDSNGESYGIFADDLSEGEEIFAFCKGNGSETVIFDYRKER